MAYINGKEILFSAIVDTVEQAELKKLEADNEELTSQNANLTSQNKQLTSQNEQLTIRNEELTTANTSLNTTNKQLTSQNANLTSQNKQLTSQNKQLTSQNANLTSQNKQLTSENARLKSDYEQLTPDFIASLQSDSTEEIIIPDGVTKIRQYGLYRHTVSGIKLPNTLVQIFDHAFRECENLTSIIIPDSVNIISKSCFQGCTSLTKVKMSKNVKAINALLFSGCSNCLEYDFTEYTSVPTLANVNAFDGINPNAKIKVPNTLYTDWVAATNWSKYDSHIEAVTMYIVTPMNDTNVASVAVNASQYVTMGFYFSDNLRNGTRYVSNTDIDGYPIVYELSSAEAQSWLTMNRSWLGDNYTAGDYEVLGEFYSGDIRFHNVGTYKIYQTYYDADGNEYRTGSYIFEVTR